MVDEFRVLAQIRSINQFQVNPAQYCITCTFIRFVQVFPKFLIHPAFSQQK
jgi:hypothetical protein